MKNSNVGDRISTEKWAGVAPELKLTQLDDLVRDGVHIQCINSTDFVVGRQTNFNGPVTIIDYANLPGKKSSDESKHLEEVLIVRGEILSKTAVVKVRKMAEKKSKACKGDSLPSEALTSQKQQMWFQKLIPALVCIGFVATVAIALIVLFIRLSTEREESLSRCTHLRNDTCIYSEFDWGGHPEPEQVRPLKTPVAYVVISQTYGSYCYEKGTCLKIVEEFQRRGTNGTACNFLLGGDGNVYEDRGWIWENSLEGPAAGKALQISFMGNYTDDFPTYPQMKAAQLLIQFGVDNNFILKDYVLAASNATSRGSCLATIYKIIKKWPNFKETPFSRR